MKFLDDAAFRVLAKQHKAISDPIRKSLSAPVQMVGPRQAKFVFSSETVDRDYDVVRQSGIDVSHFAKNPVCFWGHLHDEAPIGKCVDISIEHGNLVGVIEFAPQDNPLVGAKAEGLLQLVQGGFISTVSIGFIPRSIAQPDDDAERYNHDGVDVLQSELVEVSLVGIPANREAILQAVAPALVAADPVLTLPDPEPVKRLRAARLKRVLAVMR